MVFGRLFSDLKVASVTEFWEACSLAGGHGSNRVRFRRPPSNPNLLGASSQKVVLGKEGGVLENDLDWIWRGPRSKRTCGEGVAEDSELSSVQRRSVQRRRASGRYRAATVRLLSAIQCKREGYIQKIKDEEGEGCTIKGFVEVSKVAGNFHFAPGKGFHHSRSFLQDLLVFQTESYNISHRINRLSFGKDFPGFVNPLDGVQWTQQTMSGIYQYFIKVVPTVYIDITGRKIHSNQFSVTEHFSEANYYPHPPPGAYFFYDLSPIKVIFTEENKSLLHFLTNICAIVGGIFTISGIIDALVYHGHQAIKKKMEIGKYG